MNINQDTIGLIKQRLEILWQLVESLETGGGGGGTSDYSELSNKPQINNTTLDGNKTAAQLGLATSTSVSGLTSRFEDLFALDSITLETDDEYPSSIDSLLTLHEPLNINDVNYYFFEESGIDYSYFAVDTGGAYPKISYAQFLKDSHRVIFYDFETDTVPTVSSNNFITSGGVYTTLNPSTYVVPDLHNHNNTKITVESGGYTKIGKLVVLNVRINTSAALTQTGIFTNLPNPLSDNGLDMGSGVVSVANNINATFYITNNGNLTMKSGTSVPSSTMVCLSCAYICK